MTTKVMNSVLKTTDQKILVEQVQKMLQHFETYNFLNIDSNKLVQFDFLTESLAKIIHSEWLLTNTVFCDQPSFLFKSLNDENKIKTAFKKVKNMVSVVPFSLVEVDHSGVVNDHWASLPEAKNSVDLVKNLFKYCNGTVLKNYTFCSPVEGIEFFHKQQRDRKIWWRKFSANPGRFSITNISNDESNKSQNVEIQAEFPWGFETVEHVSYLPNFLPNDNTFFEIKSQRKKFIPHVVTCKTSLEKMAFTYLCDSYEPLNENTDREILRFGRKLAPYKIAFAATATLAEASQNLKELALLLAKKIRKCGISVLLLPDICSISIEKQVLKNDALGIPYTIILNENTLKDGLIAVRSRNTTLKEQSHVSLIVPYVEKLMKNY